MTTAYPYILVVNSELPARTLQEFVALARSKPGAMNYGSTGVGAANHLVAELFNSKAGLQMTHVPYRGTALAVGDLLGGQLTMVFGDPISVLPHIKSGKLRALAVTSLARSPVAPEVPTVAESGYPGFEALAWHGILAPARTPPAVIRKLNEEIVKALGDPDTKALLVNQAMQTVGNTPEQFAAFIQKDIATWKAVAAAANVTVEIMASFDSYLGTSHRRQARHITALVESPYRVDQRPDVVAGAPALRLVQKLALDFAVLQRVGRAAARRLGRGAVLPAVPGPEIHFHGDRRDRGIARHLDLAPHLPDRRLVHAGIGELFQPGLAQHQRRRHGVLQAHLRFASARDLGPVGALQQQRIAAHRDAFDQRRRDAARRQSSAQSSRGWITKPAG